MVFGRRIFKKLKNQFELFMVFVLLVAQFSFIPSLINTTPVHAATVCVDDTAGANDEPGQKDLTQLCQNDSPASGTEVISWNWDDLGTSGNNTMDACALFDSDGDSKINYSVCVTTSNSPATFSTLKIYSCTDSKVDRCQSPNSVIAGPYDTDCSTISQKSTDPFPAGDFSPIDTVAECTFVLSDLPTNPSSLDLTDVCSYPSQQPNSDPSDCVIITDEPVALVEVIKDVDPDTDPGKFNLSIDGPNNDDTTTIANQGDQGTTGIVAVTPKKNSNTVISETAGTNTSLSDYTSSVECVDRGTTNIVASSSNTSANFEVEDGDNVVCTIINKLKQGMLKVVKDVINDDGGTKTYADFKFKVNGGDAQNFDETTSPDGEKVLTLSPGTYSVVEPEANTMGYSTSYDNCNNVQVVNGQTTTCTITNNDIAPTLTLKKVVENENGGNANADDWKLKAVSSEGTLLEEAGGPADQSTATSQTADAKAAIGYTLSEHDGPTGYSASNWECDGGNLQDDVVTLSLDEDVTCTITNTDVVPQLTIVKDLTTDNGGNKTASDFVLHLNGGDYDGTEAFSTGNTPAVESNVAYTLSETEIFGYANNGVSCIDDNGGGVVPHPVTLDEGQHVTCTIHNDDIAPKLTVTKVVTSNNGGTLQVSNFPLFVDQLQVTSGAQNEFSAGTYTVSETQQLGYEFMGFSDDCLSDGSITLEVGGVYTCTLTNDDVPAKITVTKIITNDDGGTAVVGDFDLKVNTTDVDSGVQNTFNGNLPVTITEQANVDGYTNTDIECYDLTADDNIDLGDSFTTKLAHEYDCTITNDDNTPELTLVKVVYNDFGQADSPNDWTLSATPENNQVGAVVLSGDGDPTDGGGVNDAPSKAGVMYTLNESNGPDGYEPSSWQCSGGSLNGDELTLALGDDVTCSITNRAKAPQLTVIKHVINDNGGTKNADDFTMLIDGTEVSDSAFPGVEDPGTTVTLDSGNYSVSETGPDGYDASYSDDCSGSINLGESKTCTVTNDDIAPVLRLKKTVVNDNGGDASATDWRLKAAKFLSPSLINEYGQDAGNDMAITDGHTAKAGDAYFLSESGPHGYDAYDWECDGGTLGTYYGYFYVKLDLGEEVTCSIVNDDIAPKVFIKKLTYPYVSDQEFDFEIVNQALGANDYHTYPVTLDTNNSDSTNPQSEWVELETAGTVSVEEIEVDGWKTIPVCLTRNHSPKWWNALDDDSNNKFETNIDVGETLYCVFINIQLGDVKVTKFHDANENGYWDDGEPTLPGWEMQLQIEKFLHNTEYLNQTTEDNGMTVFEDLLPNPQIIGNFRFIEYQLEEILKDDWRQTNIYCSQNVRDDLFSLNGYVYNSQEVEVRPGQTTECFVGNVPNANYTIDKSNDATDALLPGQSVIYQLVVSNPEFSSILRDVRVYDLMPEGITYVSGSAKIDGTSAVPEPDYTTSDPAVWELGDMNPGDTVTLTYTATVDDDTQPGTYTNVAWTDACEQGNVVLLRQLDNLVEIDENPRCYYDQHEILGNVSPSCNVPPVYSLSLVDAVVQPQDEPDCDPFVESDVTVAAVLGEAETFVLAVTGAPAILMPVVGLTVMAVALVASLPNRKLRRLFGRLGAFSRSSAVSMLALVLSVSIVASASAAANAWKLTVADLAPTTTQSSLNLPFSIAATDAGNQFDVTIDVDGPGSNDYSNTLTDVNRLSSSFDFPLPVDGEYSVTVAATADYGTATSPTAVAQTVTRDTNAPPAVVYGGVQRDGNTYTLTFKASGASKIQIFASTSQSFATDQSNLVGEVDGSETSFVYTAPDSNQRYFALVAVDDAGNRSSVVGDTGTTVTDGADYGVISSSAATDSNQANDDQGQEQGATTDTDDNAADNDDNSNSTAITILVLIGLGGLLYYYLVRRPNDVSN